VIVYAELLSIPRLCVPRTVRLVVDDIDLIRGDVSEIDDSRVGNLVVIDLNRVRNQFFDV
jgi:hypothetical protein